MRRNKSGLAVAICLFAALSAMAFIATGAPANGHLFVDLQLLNEAMEVESLNPDHVELLSLLGLGNKVQVLCTNIVSHDALLFSNGSGSAEVLFSSCETRVNLSLIVSCKPLEPIVANVTSLLINHNNDTYVLFALQDEVTKVHYQPICIVAFNIVVRGQSVAECGALSGGAWEHKDCSTEEVEHEIREVPGTTLFPNDRLKFGTFPASLHGDISLILKGPQSGVNWGGEAL
jgi:hypothetical protein